MRSNNVLAKYDEKPRHIPIAGAFFEHQGFLLAFLHIIGYNTQVIKAVNDPQKVKES